MDKKKEFNADLYKKVIKALCLNHFDARYFKTREEAIEAVLSCVKKTDIVSFGGSVTVSELGILEKIGAIGCNILDRSKGTTPQEKEDIARAGLLSDVYLMSSNAITQDGYLFNIDGVGNRIAALTYGPKTVFILAGVNKIVRDTEEAVQKVRNYTAPLNAQRFEIDTPCKKTKECGDCKSLTSICSVFTLTRLCRPAGRIKVFLINEELGF